MKFCFLWAWDGQESKAVRNSSQILQKLTAIPLNWKQLCLMVPDFSGTQRNEFTSGWASGHKPSGFSFFHTIRGVQNVSANLSQMPHFKCRTAGDGAAAIRSDFQNFWSVSSLRQPILHLKQQFHMRDRTFHKSAPSNLLERKDFSHSCTQSLREWGNCAPTFLPVRAQSQTAWARPLRRARRDLR